MTFILGQNALLAYSIDCHNLTAIGGRQLSKFHGSVVGRDSLKALVSRMHISENARNALNDQEGEYGQPQGFGDVTCNKSLGWERGKGKGEIQQTSA